MDGESEAQRRGSDLLSVPDFPNAVLSPLYQATSDFDRMKNQRKVRYII